jgi:hypothetical protein
MKTRTLISISTLVLAVLIVIGSCATTKKAISKQEAMDALCHTWTKPAGTTGTDKDVYKRDGTFEWSYEVDSTEPSIKGNFKIEEAWSDREGNIWIFAWFDYWGGFKYLCKISNSGTVMEMKKYYGDIPPDIEEMTFPYIYYRQE